MGSLANFSYNGKPYRGQILQYDAENHNYEVKVIQADLGKLTHILAYSGIFKHV